MVTPPVDVDQCPISPRDPDAGDPESVLLEPVLQDKDGHLPNGAIRVPERLYGQV